MTMSAAMRETVRLDKDRRFTIDRDLLKKLGANFQSDATVQLWALLGQGRLQVLPNECRLAKLRDVYSSDDSALTWDASSDESAHFERVISSLIPVSFRPHGRKIRCTLPAEIDELGLFTPP